MRSTLKTIPRQIRLTARLWSELARIATADGKSRAELIRDVLQRFAQWRQSKTG